MSFFSDLFEGNFGNLGHDLSAHFTQDLPWYLGAATAGIGGAGLAGIGPAAGLLGGGAAAGADVAGTVGGEAAGLGLAGDAGAGGAAAAGDAAAGGSSILPDWLTKSFTSNPAGWLGAGVGGAGLLAQILGSSGAGGGVPGGAPLAGLADQSRAGATQLGVESQGTTSALSAESAATTQALIDRLKQQYASTTGQIDPFVQQSLDTRSQLLDPLTSGKLPAAAEQSVVNATNDAKAALRSRYAQLGLSGSSAEADALANIDNQATSQRFSIAQNMAQTAMSASDQALRAIMAETTAQTGLLGQEAGLASGDIKTRAGLASGDIATRAGLLGGSLGLQQQVFSALMNQQVSQNKDLQSAIGNFANALGKVQGSKTATTTNA